TSNRLPELAQTAMSLRGGCADGVVTDRVLGEGGEPGLQVHGARGGEIGCDRLFDGAWGHPISKWTMANKTLPPLAPASGEGWGGRRRPLPPPPQPLQRQGEQSCK